nr:hypothetical protein Iba_scaffold60851CG0010 [Ipomoea batatas]GMD36785.1 hypothetical protein Iba_chr09eCG3250 [Ipomoea batatas]
MYFRIASVPEGLKMFVAGIRKLSTGISLPIVPNMTAAPPALCTSNVWDKPPARQNTTFPFTFSGESVSCRQNLGVVVDPGISTSPANTTGSVSCFLISVMLSPCTSMLFPNKTGAENTRSMLLAPTVKIQGATFATLYGSL